MGGSPHDVPKFYTAPPELKGRDGALPASLNLSRGTSTPSACACAIYLRGVSKPSPVDCSALLPKLLYIFALQRNVFYSSGPQGCRAASEDVWTFCTNDVWALKVKALFRTLSPLPAHPGGLHTRLVGTCPQFLDTSRQPAHSACGAGMWERCPGSGCSFLDMSTQSAQVNQRKNSCNRIAAT